MLVSTHNLGSVSEFCDYTVMVKGTVLASGPTETTFTAENLERFQRRAAPRGAQRLGRSHYYRR
jgi:ABC-type Mn2+/Zn2+ transport system ATPase subunit